jgi:hypothetical protein
MAFRVRRGMSGSVGVGCMREVWSTDEALLAWCSVQKYGDSLSGFVHVRSGAGHVGRAFCPITYVCIMYYFTLNTMVWLLCLTLTFRESRLFVLTRRMLGG